VTSSLLGVFLVLVVIVRRERREDARILGRQTLFAGAQVWKEGMMCGVEGRYTVEGRKAVMPRAAGKVRFKESRKEVLPILRRESRDEGGKQV
jgi:hypothetical protein